MSRNDECLSPQQESLSPNAINVMDSQSSQHPLLTAAAHASMLPAFSTQSTPQGSSSPSSSSPSPLSLRGTLSHPISGDLPSNVIPLISSPSLGFEITTHEQIESPVNARSPAIPSSVASTPTEYIFDSKLLQPTNITGVDEEEEEDKSVPVCQWDGCGTQCLSLQLLVAHLEHDHTIAASHYVCKWAGCPRQQKPFDARYKLVTHLRCHTGERPYKCTHDSCKRTFSRLENLKLHMRTHTGEKPYSCHHEGCEKKFNNTSDRAKHMKTHVTRKPYVCKHLGCSKAYTDPSSMRKHIKFSHRNKDRSTSYSAPSPEQLIHGSFSTYPKLAKSAPSTPRQVQKEQGSISPVYQLPVQTDALQSPTSLLYLQNGVQISTPTVQHHLQSTSVNQPMVVVMPVTRDSQRTVLLANQSIPFLTTANIIHPSVSRVGISTNSSRGCIESNANSSSHHMPPLVQFLQPQQQLLVVPQLQERTQSFTILQQPISPPAQILNCLAQPQTQVMVPVSSLTQSSHLTSSPSSCAPALSPTSVTGQVQPILLPVVPTTTPNH